MSYKKGELLHLTPKADEDCYYGHCDCGGFHSMSNDSPDTGAALPHSCNEWVIGGPKEIEDLIADLQDVLLKLK